MFEGTKEQIRSSVDHIRKMLALYFRFSILDKNFSIYVNEERVGLDDLTDLLDSTEFVWIINKYEDEFVKALPQLKNKPIALTTPQHPRLHRDSRKAAEFEDNRH